MPFCLNSECPHRIRTGNPAEFQNGIAQCLDCGSMLQEVKQETLEQVGLLPSHLIRRLAFTLVILVLYRLLLLIPPPGINTSVLSGATGEILAALHFPHISILALGLMPYVSAYVIVEIFSVLIPPFKSWRAQGTRGRQKLFKSACFGTVLFAFLQGFQMAGGFEHIVLLDGTPLVLNPGWPFRLLCMLSITAGSFLLLWLAHLISTRGVGHGISILIFGGYVFSLLSWLLQYPKGSPDREPFEAFLIYLFSLGISIVAIVFAERRHKEIAVKFADGMDAKLSLKMTTAGTSPATIGALLTTLPITLATLFGWSFLQFYEHNSILYYVVYVITILVLYFVLTALFHNPDGLVDYLRKRNASVIFSGTTEPARFLEKSLELMALCGVIYLIVLTVVFDLASKVCRMPLGAIAIITLVTIVLDVCREFNFRRDYEALCKVAEFHDLPKATLVKSVLVQKGIPCLLKGYYHRGLLYFFGPYVEISALVPKSKATEAFELIDAYQLS
ncbi:MAG: hypothetical protein ACFFCW_20815 [Candidatus Hodarchaeota archaeon]